MEYVSPAGLRARGSNTNAIAGAIVSDAVDAVREAPALMAASTVTTLSGHFEAFVAAVESLIGLAETGTEFGISGTGEAAANDPWHAYGA